MDYTPIEAFLVGRCGKTEVQAARTSYGEFLLLAEGRKQQDREDWERRRWEIYMHWAISPNLKRRPNKPQDVFLFPWEKVAQEVENAEPLTEQELCSLCEIFKLNREDIVNGQD
jgi:hypothetical protein